VSARRPLALNVEQMEAASVALLSVDAAVNAFEEAYDAAGIWGSVEVWYGGAVIGRIERIDSETWVYRLESVGEDS
jgi:hypothetical protein